MGDETSMDAPQRVVLTGMCGADACCNFTDIPLLGRYVGPFGSFVGRPCFRTNLERSCLQFFGDLRHHQQKRRRILLLDK